MARGGDDAVAWGGVRFCCLCAGSVVVGLRWCFGDGACVRISMLWSIVLDFFYLWWCGECTLGLGSEVGIWGGWLAIW